MQQIPNPMANLYQSQLQASRRFADAVFNGTEKLDRIVLEATHRAVNDQLALAQAVAAGQTPADAGLTSSFMRRNSGEAVNYQAEIMRVVAEMQSEIGRSMQEYIEQVGSQAASAPQQATTMSRASTGATGAMTTYNPMTTMFSFWENAFKEATAMAARNMEAVRSTARTATESVGSASRSTTRAAAHAANGATDAARKAAEGGNGAGSRRRH